MRFDIITIFPELFTGVLECGIVRRALQSQLLEVRVVNLRDFTSDRHRTVDDRPYGGGEGMVLMPGPLFDAVEFCRGSESEAGTQVILLSPQGKLWSQEIAQEFTTISHAILICGRYEGVDQRVVDNLVDRELSIGDFILTGGEIPAMVILDSVVRLLPGALGNKESARKREFLHGIAGFPAIHASCRVPRHVRARGFTFWRSRQNRPMAQRAGFREDPGVPTRDGQEIIP